MAGNTADRMQSVIFDSNGEGHGHVVRLVPATPVVPDDPRAVINLQPSLDDSASGPRPSPRPLSPFSRCLSVGSPARWQCRHPSPESPPPVQCLPGPQASLWYDLPWCHCVRAAWISLLFQLNLVWVNSEWWDDPSHAHSYPCPPPTSLRAWPRRYNIHRRQITRLISLFIIFFTLKWRTSPVRGNAVTDGFKWLKRLQTIINNKITNLGARAWVSICLGCTPYCAASETN